MTLSKSNEQRYSFGRSPGTTRLAVRLRAILAWPWHGDRPVELRDISSTGFCGARPQGLESGMEIVAEMPGLGAVEARVKWVDGDSFGAEFAGPPDLRRLFLLRVSTPLESRVTTLAA